MGAGPEARRRVVEQRCLCTRGASEFLQRVCRELPADANHLRGFDDKCYRLIVLEQVVGRGVGQKLVYELGAADEYQGVAIGGGTREIGGSNFFSSCHTNFDICKMSRLLLTVP